MMNPFVTTDQKTLKSDLNKQNKIFLSKQIFLIKIY